MGKTLTPFHLAIPVNEIEETRKFYRDIIGCKEGRSSDKWVDFNFYGHQLVIHISGSHSNVSDLNPVDGHDVPVPHFGIVLRWDDWENLRDRLVASEMRFTIEPHIRFEGQIGEQATMFFYDPSGNALEFKSFKDFSQIFAN